MTNEEMQELANLNRRRADELFAELSEAIRSGAYLLQHPSTYKNGSEQIVNELCATIRDAVDQQEKLWKIGKELQ